MTAFPYAVDLNAPITEARALMLEHHVRHLPVTQNHQLRGIVSDRDIKLLLGLDSLADRRDQLPDSGPFALTVEDAYLGDCYTVDLETPLRIVLAHMADRHIGAAVITSHGRLAGIFTATDACRAYADYLDGQFGPPSSRGPPDVA